MNKVKSAFCLIQLFSSSKQIKTKHASSPVINGLNNFVPVKWPRSDYFVVCEFNWIGEENTRTASLFVKDLFHLSRMDIDRASFFKQLDLIGKTHLRLNIPFFASRSSTCFQFSFFISLGYFLIAAQRLNSAVCNFYGLLPRRGEEIKTENQP